MNIQKMARAALIAAVYVALCFAFAPLSYGMVQVRFAEALALLPVLCPEAVVGVTLGCFVANTLGGAPIDMLVGTVATLLAALATRRLRHLRWRGLSLTASLPPILFNAVIVGGEIAVLSGGGMQMWLLCMASVGAGQLVSCGVLGVLLVWFIQRTPALLRLFQHQGAPPPG